MSQLSVSVTSMSKVNLEKLVEFVQGSGFGSAKKTRRESSPQEILNEIPPLRQYKYPVLRSSSKSKDWAPLYSDLVSLVSNLSDLGSTFEVSLSGSLGGTVVLPEFNHVPFSFPGCGVNISYRGVAPAVAHLPSYTVPFTSVTIKSSIEDLAQSCVLDHPMFRLAERTRFGRVLTNKKNYSAYDVLHSLNLGGFSAGVPVLDLGSSGHHVTSTTFYSDAVNIHPDLVDCPVYMGSMSLTKVELASLNAMGIEVGVSQTVSAGDPFFACVFLNGDVVTRFDTASFLLFFN